MRVEKFGTLSIKEDGGLVIEHFNIDLAGSNGPVGKIVRLEFDDEDRFLGAMALAILKYIVANGMLKEET